MSELFFAGVPTSVDVDALMKIEVGPGAVVPYQAVEEIIGEARGSNRFRTVTMAWRKRLFRERLLQTKAEGGAFHILTADEAQDRAVRDVSRVGRAAGRLRVRVEAIDATQLTGDRLTRQMLLRREAQAMQEAVSKSARAIAGPKPHTPVGQRLAPSAGE